MDQVTLTLAETRDLATRALLASGADRRNADAVAETVTAAERDDAKSHGLFRIPGYCASLKSGKVNGAARPRVTRLAPAVVRVDGDRGLAPLAIAEGRQPLIDLAREQGIAAQAFIDCFHFAALWPEVEPLAEQGLCAIAVTAAKSFVAPAGGAKPLYGTNPMSFAWPRKDGPPIVFDQASSRLARGEIQIAARDGHAVPADAGVDRDGNPTTDPNAILEGAQLAFGGYKGAAIALMIELLAGSLVGDDLSFEASQNDNGDGGPTKGGELIVAMDPARFGAANSFLDSGERLFAKIAEQPGTRLPGDRRFAARKRTPTEGIAIPKSLHGAIAALAG